MCHRFFETNCGLLSKKVFHFESIYKKFWGKWFIIFLLEKRQCEKFLSLDFNLSQLFWLALRINKYMTSQKNLKEFTLTRFMNILPLSTCCEKLWLINVASSAKFLGEFRLLPSSCGGSAAVSLTVSRSVKKHCLNKKSNLCLTFDE